MASPPPLPPSLFDDDVVLVPAVSPRQKRRKKMAMSQPSSLSGPSMAILELERVRRELLQAQSVAEASRHHQQNANAAQAQLAQLQHQLFDLRERLRNKEVELRQILKRIAESRSAERDLSANLEQTKEQLEHSQGINRRLETSRSRLRERAQKLDRSLRRLAKETHLRFLALRSEHSAHARTQLALAEERQALRRARAALEQCQDELHRTRQQALGPSSSLPHASPELADRAPHDHTEELRRLQDSIRQLERQNLTLIAQRDALKNPLDSTVQIQEHLALPS